MPERPSLDHAFDRLRWARKHFEILRQEVEPFEERDSHTISVEVKADVGEYVFCVHDLEPVDPDWGLIIGDCIHNARVALDYLMVRLWALVTGQDVRMIEHVSFPIFAPSFPDPIESDEQVTSAFATAREEFSSRTRKYRKEPLFGGYLARIEERQPFNSGNPSIWGAPSFQSGGEIIVAGPHLHPLPTALQRLSILDNIDKHRVVHAAWLGVNIWRAMHREADIRFPPEFKQKSSSTAGEPLVDGAEIGRLYFETPLPFEWQPNQVDMKRGFPLQVAFDEPTPFNGVLEVLPFCLWGVESVLRLFEPVFTSLQPPLPVTAIPYPS